MRGPQPGSPDLINVLERYVEEAKKVSGQRYGVTDGAGLLVASDTTNGGLFVQVLGENVVVQ